MKDMDRFGLTFVKSNGRKYVARKGKYISECNDCGSLIIANKEDRCPICASSDHHDFEKGEEDMLLRRMLNGDMVVE